MYPIPKLFDRIRNLILIALIQSSTFVYIKFWKTIIFKTKQKKMKRKYLIDHQFEVNRSLTIPQTSTVDDIFSPGTAFNVNDTINCWGKKIASQLQLQKYNFPIRKLTRWTFNLDSNQWAKVSGSIFERIEVTGKASRWIIRHTSEIFLIWRTVTVTGNPNLFSLK